VRYTVRAGDIMRDNSEWRFVTSTQKRDDWRWQQVNREGEVVKRSRESFAFLLECVADARKHGYVPSTQDAGP
jgi:hypothetical protein